MTTIIRCEKEPFRCRSDYPPCRLGDFGRGSKTLSGGVHNKDDIYIKNCWVCDTCHEYICTDKTGHLSREQQQQIWKSYIRKNNKP